MYNKGLIKMGIVFFLFFALLAISGCSGGSAGGPLGFLGDAGETLIGGDGSGGGNPSSSTPIANPEPSSLLLFASGLIGMAVYGRKRQKK